MRPISRRRYEVRHLAYTAEMEELMIRLGEIQTLQILKRVDFGVYLWDGEDSKERVLLPRKQVPEQA